MEGPVPKCALRNISLVTGYSAMLADGESWPGKKRLREEMTETRSLRTSQSGGSDTVYTNRMSGTKEAQLWDGTASRADASHALWEP